MLERQEVHQQIDRRRDALHQPRRNEIDATGGGNLALGPDQIDAAREEVAEESCSQQHVQRQVDLERGLDAEHPHEVARRAAVATADLHQGPDPAVAHQFADGDRPATDPDGVKPAVDPALPERQRHPDTAEVVGLIEQGDPVLG